MIRCTCWRKRAELGNWRAMTNVPTSGQLDGTGGASRRIPGRPGATCGWRSSGVAPAVRRSHRILRTIAALTAPGNPGSSERPQDGQAGTTAAPAVPAAPAAQRDGAALAVHVCSRFAAGLQPVRRGFPCTLGAAGPSMVRKSAVKPPTSPPKVGWPLRYMLPRCRRAGAAAALGRPKHRGP